MCGIVGVLGDINFKERKAFRDMLVFDIVRGIDSTGIIQINSDGTCVSDKDLGTPHEGLFQSSDLVDSKGVIKKFNVKGLIGHNRAATAGKVNVENAHPFTCGSITGVHNGTLNLNQSEFDGKNDFPVDSWALIDALSQNGYEEVIPKTCGAYSLVWYDEEDKTVSFIRNSRRPMYYRKSEDEKTLFFASEPWMIEVACERHNIKLIEAEAISTDVDTLYQADLAPTNFTKSLDFIYYEGTVEGKKETYVRGNHYYGGTVYDFRYREKEDVLSPKTSTTRVKFLDGGLKMVYNSRDVLIETWKDGKKIWDIETGPCDKVGDKEDEGKSNVIALPSSKSTTQTVIGPSIDYVADKVKEIHDNFVYLFLPRDYVKDDEYIIMETLDEGYPCKIFHNKDQKLLDEVINSENQWFSGKVYNSIKGGDNPFGGFLLVRSNSLQGPFEGYGQGQAFLNDLKERDKVEEDEWEINCHKEKEWTTSKLFKGPYGIWMSRDEWFNQVKSDCCELCGSNDVNPEDGEDMYWTNGGGYFCTNCNYSFGNFGG